MLRCYIGGALFRVRFMHYENRDERALSKKKTICYIHEGLDDFPSYTGLASCSKQDNFCRETGRKLALRRAIAAWPRSARRELWTSYFNRGKASAAPMMPVQPTLPPEGAEVVM